MELFFTLASIVLILYLLPYIIALAFAAVAMVAGVIGLTIAFVSKLLNR